MYLYQSKQSKAYQTLGQLIKRPQSRFVIVLFILTLLVAIDISGDRQAYAQSLDYYVAPTGDDNNPCTSSLSPCATIGAALNKSPSGGTVHVAAGTYNENIVMKSGVNVIGASPSNTSIVGIASTSGVVSFSNVTNAKLQGFRITVDAPIPGVDRAVVFTGSSDQTAVLQNNIIQNTQYGIFVWAPSTPTIENNTLVGGPDEQGIYIGNAATAPMIRNNIINGYFFAGIHVVAGEASPLPTIAYNDLWDNGENYRNYPDQTNLNGNISADPLFINAPSADYHLSETPTSSPAIDAGDPSSSYASEPAPNGGRINMGAYGNTAEAANSPASIDLPDLVVSALTVTNFDASSIAYEYTITNVGSAPANLDGPTNSNFDNVSVQAYLSQDQIFNNAGDSAAGGTILGSSPLGNLDPGESFTGSFGASTSVNPADMQYLILMVDWGEVVDEVDETNNTLAVPIESSSILIDSAYTETPPVIDGSLGFNEWEISNQIPFENGFLTVLNDGIRLYIMVDVLDDTTADDDTPPDYFWLTFDVNDDNAISPNVDLNYGIEPSTGNMRYSYYLGPGSWTGLQPNTFSSQGRGFGCFFADGSRSFSLFPFNISCDQHRVWEFGIDLAEIGAQAGDTVNMGLRVNSETPDFTNDLPTNFFNDFSSLIQVNLAPLPAPLPPADSNASLGFETDAIELTQAIQNRANTLPLVADKRTVSRLYVDVSGVVTDQPAIVHLYGSQGGVDLPGSPLATLHTAPPTINRNQLDDTVNLPLPAAWDNAGAVDFQGKVRDLFGNVSTSPSQNISFNAREVPVYWVVPINTGTAQTPILPNDAEIASQQSYLETVFPVSDMRFVRKNWQAVGVTTVGNTINALNDYYDATIIAWATGIINTGEESFTLPEQIYGFTPSGGGISDPTWIGNRGRVARGFRGTSREATMAHEIDHNLDRSSNGTWGRHLPFGCGAGGPDPSWPFLNDDIQEVGFDTRTPWVDGSGTQDTVIPTNFPDFMSYCQSDDLPGIPPNQLPTKWISTYRWNQLFNNAFPTTAARSASLAAMVETVYYVSGYVTISDTGKLNPITVQPGIPTTGVPTGDYVIEMQDAGGNVLSSMPFFVSFIDPEGQPIDTAYFNFQLVEQTGAAKIVLKKNDQVLDTIVVSDNPPIIEVISPNGGETWSSSGTVEWEASDSDGDPLQATILYSPDNGTSWYPVAGNQQGNQYPVNTTDVPASDQAKMRVIVTDGFNTVQDDSDAVFTIEATNGPEVSILQPMTNEQFTSGQTILFKGEASDLEDGPLADDSFVWSYGTTTFGIGKSVEAILPDGTHEVTLTVVDSDSNQTSKTVTVYVGIAKPQNGTIEISKAAADSETTFSFALNDMAFTLKQGESQQFDALTPGQHVARETVLEGWTLTEIRCDNGLVLIAPELPEVVINLNANQTVRCTFINERSNIGRFPYSLYLPFISK